MSTARNEGNNSGSDGNISSSGKKNNGLYIQMLQRGGDGMDSDMNKCLNLFLCFIALCILYGFYIAFGLAWLTAMTELGEDLNWAFLGVMVAVGGGMMSAVAYSMKSQQKGWWEPLSRDDARNERDPRGKCCGFQIY